LVASLTIPATLHSPYSIGSLVADIQQMFPDELTVLSFCEKRDIILRRLNISHSATSKHLQDGYKFSALLHPIRTLDTFHRVRLSNENEQK
jgi:hypothetical protein